MHRHLLTQNQRAEDSSQQTNLNISTIKESGQLK